MKKLKWRVHFRHRFHGETGRWTDVYDSQNDAEKAIRLSGSTAHYDIWDQPEEVEVAPEPDEPLYDFTGTCGDFALGRTGLTYSQACAYSVVFKTLWPSGRCVDARVKPKPYEPRWIIEAVDSLPFARSQFAVRFIDRSNGTYRTYCDKKQAADLKIALGDVARWLDMDPKARDERLDALYAEQHP